MLHKATKTKESQRGLCRNFVSPKFGGNFVPYSFCVGFLAHRIHGTIGIFTYMETIKNQPFMQVNIPFPWILRKLFEQTFVFVGRFCKFIPRSRGGFLSGIKAREKVASWWSRKRDIKKTSFCPERTKNKSIPCFKFHVVNDDVFCDWGRCF